MSEVHNTKSENWCLKSTIGSLMYEVWRNLKFDARKLSELCRKSEVQSMSKIRVWNQSLKSVSCMLSKSETEVQSLTPKIWSWKSEVESLSEVRFCNYYNFVIQYHYYILCVCRLIITIAGQMYRKPAYSYNYFRPSQIFISPFFNWGLLYYNLIRRSYYQNI